jgi:hypothetical protein
MCYQDLLVPASLCPRCSRENRSGAVFCDQCGTRLPTGSVPTFASPQSYILSFAKTLSARLIDLRSVWGLETLETGTRPEVCVARRRAGGDKILGATQNDPEERCKQPA